MLKRNTSDSYPGATYVGSDPVSEAECCLLRSVAAIAAAADASGAPYAIRGGRIFVDISDEDKVDLCLGLEPAPASTVPPIMQVASSAEVAGTSFGAVEGELWLTENADWELSLTKVEQTVTAWLDELITITVVGDGLPESPTKVYLWVINACGRRNLVGLEAEIQTV